MLAVKHISVEYGKFFGLWQLPIGGGLVIDVVSSRPKGPAFDFQPLPIIFSEPGVHW